MIKINIYHDHEINIYVGNNTVYVYIYIVSIFIYWKIDMYMFNIYLNYFQNFAIASKQA